MIVSIKQPQLFNKIGKIKELKLLREKRNLGLVDNINYLLSKSDAN
jgi:hypothetical protein